MLLPDRLVLEKSELLRLISSEPSDGISLQIGIGHGTTPMALMNLGVDLKCVDIYFNYLSDLQSLTDTNRIRCTNANIQELPFQDSVAGKLICLEVLEHVDDVDAAIQEIARVVKQHGRIYISVPTRRSEILFGILNPKWLEVCGHKRVFRKSELLRALNGKGIEVDGIYSSNFKASFYWVWHALARTHHDGTGKVRANFWLDNCINLYWRFLTRFRLANIFNTVGGVIFPKSYIFICRRV